MKKDNLYTQVETILVTEPETRNSDITLMIALWRRYYPETIVKDIGVYLKDLYDLPREDNIKRHRATIQNKETRLLPTDMKIFIERAKASKEWKARLGYNTGMVSTKNYEEILTNYYQQKVATGQPKLF
jgi:hypothetical protein